MEQLTQLYTQLLYVIMKIFYKVCCNVIFAAPEKVTSDNVGVAADIWGVGVLSFILWVYKFTLLCKSIVPLGIFFFSNYLGKMFSTDKRFLKVAKLNIDLFHV